MAWVDHFERLDIGADAVNATPDQIAALDVDPRDRERYTDLKAAARALLSELAERGWLRLTVTRTCPICGFELEPDYDDPTCPNSEGSSHAFTDEGASGPVEVHRYQRAGVDRRYVAWLLALHGVNTRGAWQEDFNWLVSTSYGRMVPVGIYRYGRIRPGVLFRFRHRKLMRGLNARIRKLSAQARRVVYDPRPDVIAHSFGSFLLGHALHADPELKVGRVITLGCILRPDFDWATLVKRGQVEAVLNHYGTEDFWAWIAHYVVPDAGPAGRRGFDFYEESWPENKRAPGSRVIFNVAADRLGHSDFFENEGVAPTTLARLFTDVWKPFLVTNSTTDVAAALDEVWPPARWRPSPWPLRAIGGGRKPVPQYSQPNVRRRLRLGPRREEPKMAEPGIAEKVLAAVNILNDPEKTEDAPIQPPALNVTRVGGLAAFIASAGAAALTLFNIEKTDDIALRIAAIAGTAVIVAVSLIAAAIIIAADVRARSTVVASPSEESDESTEKETIDKYITAFDEALRDAERNGHVHPADADDLLDLIRLKNAYHAMALTLEELEAPAEFVDENNYLRTEAEGISEEAGKVAALPKAKDKRQSARAILRRVLEFRAEAAAKLREL